MSSVTRRSALRGAIAVALAPTLGSLVLPSLAAPASAAVSWKAQWIWAPSSKTNQWVAFRRSFTLGSAPTKAVTRIAADSKYWLWVNGKLVVFEGQLKRGPNPTDTYYDEIDLAPHLTSGSNTVALLVWHFGKDGFSHKSSGKGGLLFQSDIQTGSTTTQVISDTNWKHIVHPGYSQNTDGNQPNFRLPESNVYYDARNATALAGWLTSAFDDSAWTAPTGFGAAGATPWNGLVQRPIPFFRSSGLKSYTNASSLPSTGKDSTAISATLPSNLQVTPYLKVDAPAGAVIGIQTDHYADGGEFGVRSTYVCAGGVQEFESLGWMSGTAVRYTIPANVTIVELKYRESGYDTDFAGSFSSSEAFMDTLWGKASRTMYVNMRDTYMDCPTRERAQWWGDVVNQLKEGFYTFDTKSHALGEKAIAELASWQKPGGVLYSPIPGNWDKELSTQMLASVWSFWTYYLYTGKTGAVTAAYPAVKKYLDLWTLDADGLVNHRPGGWDWSDWGTNIDRRVIDNCWYHLALDTAVKLADLSGNSGDVAGWQAKRKSIGDNFDRVLWNSSKNEYRSPGYTGDTDDRANALAVIAGLAPASHYPAITKVLRTHLNASPYLEFYVLEALYLMDAAGVAEERMRNRYATQVADPACHTLWELWTKEPQGTDNHAWNGGPLYVLSAYAAGVRPTKPGWETYDVTPQTGTLTKINTVTPTVKGTIHFGIERAGDKVTLTLTSPEGTTARVGVPTYRGSRPVIKANGATVYTGSAATGSVSGLTYATKDASYVYFTVQPGTWTFAVTGAGRLDNLALGRPVTSDNSLENSDWGRSRLTDGVLTSVTGAKGYTSKPFSSADASGTPVRVEIDLGADTDLDAVRLFPRTDTSAAGGGTAGFPVDFTLQTRPDGATTYTTVRTVTGESNPQGLPQTYGFKTTTARYVRLEATKLGSPASDEPAKYRLQLAELTVPTAATTVTSNYALENSDWGKTRALDGTTTSVAGAKGFSSIEFPSADVSKDPVWLEIDLGANRAIGSITLRPGTDPVAADGSTLGFPVDFTLQTRADGATSYTTVRTVTGQVDPRGVAQEYTLDSASGRYLRLRATRLGKPVWNGTKNNFHLRLAEIRIK
ncbi:discoidin domain-containing protein [Streptomyces sp. NPDC008343]|uniref:alpha-L-rhamnosidase-related protein n=1 Tax=Streptomyces sp. NPDC008343 TaxID=3364828 RepID=UPI0036E355F7